MIRSRLIFHAEWVEQTIVFALLGGVFFQEMKEMQFLQVLFPQVVWMDAAENGFLPDGLYGLRQHFRGDA